MEGEGGLIQLSKRKADRQIAWQKIVDTTAEGDPSRAPACGRSRAACSSTSACRSSCPPRRSTSAARTRSASSSAAIRAEILKIDTERRNIVISPPQAHRARARRGEARLLETLKEGDIVTGTVKNIADFGAFVDLGGIDGLLHITDMSWGRVNHPSEVVKIDQKIEVKVLNIDLDKEKIALGLKQKEASPWEEIEASTPSVAHQGRGRQHHVLRRVRPLEDGIEGLVHISEMSWTRRVNHPSEIVSRARRSTSSSSRSTRTSRRSASA
jgi:small subunit ribosomal protein S1